MKIFISSISLLVSFQLSAGTLGLNDISILLPLPKDMTEMNQLISPNAELLPKSVYKRMPTLNVEIDQEKNYQHNLKVIGIRFDPCFMEGFAPTTCQPQIRLIWQPIIFKTNISRTMDTALHTFYNLTQDEWAQLLAEVKAISSFDTQLPLQIHPVIKTERFNSAYWQNLKKIVVKYAGLRNIVRTTVMVSRNGFIWAFRGVDWVQGQWTDIEIPTLKIPNRPEEKVINDAFFIEPASLSQLSEFRGGATLLEFSNTTWFNLLSDSKKFKQTQTEDEIKSALGLALQLENPNLHNPGTAGCVNCHLSQTVRLWGERNFKSWDFKTIFTNSMYANSNFDLTNTSVNPSDVDRVRAFGYFNAEPIISQRVINETAQILNNPL